MIICRCIHVKYHVLSIENSYVLHYYFQTVNEQPNVSMHQLHNTAVPLIWYMTPEEQMTTSGDCDLENDNQTYGSLNVMHSTVMNIREVDMKEEDDVLQSLFARH